MGKSIELRFMMETAALVLVNEFGKGWGCAWSLSEGAAFITLKRTWSMSAKSCLLVAYSGFEHVLTISWSSWSTFTWSSEKLWRSHFVWKRKVTHTRILSFWGGRKTFGWMELGCIKPDGEWDGMLLEILDLMLLNGIFAINLTLGSAAVSSWRPWRAGEALGRTCPSGPI